MVSAQQYFGLLISHFREHQNHLEGFLTHRWLALATEFPIQLILGGVDKRIYNSNKFPGAACRHHSLRTTGSDHLDFSTR